MTKRQKRGMLLILAGLTMVFCALGLHRFQEKQDALAGENVRILLRHLELSRVSIVEEDAMPSEEAPPVNQPMPEKAYLGYSMIGTLRIPSVGIELPILSTWSYDLLNVAPCRYYGSIPEENMILMGHNYKSHFTPLHDIAVGEEVEFEDVNGVVHRYTVAEIEYLHKNDGEQLPSDYPLTLFTCTPGGQNRIVVRCDASRSLK